MESLAQAFERGEGGGQRGAVLGSESRRRGGDEGAAGLVEAGEQIVSPGGGRDLDVAAVAGPGRRSIKPFASITVSRLLTVGRLSPSRSATSLEVLTVPGGRARTISICASGISGRRSAARAAESRLRRSGEMTDARRAGSRSVTRRSPRWTVGSVTAGC